MEESYTSFCCKKIKGKTPWKSKLGEIPQPNVPSLILQTHRNSLKLRWSEGAVRGGNFTLESLTNPREHLLRMSMQCPQANGAVLGLEDGSWFPESDLVSKSLPLASTVLFSWHDVRLNPQNCADTEIWVTVTYVGSTWALVSGLAWTIGKELCRCSPIKVPTTCCHQSLASKGAGVEAGILLPVCPLPEWSCCPFCSFCMRCQVVLWA